jgi:hypothetical protein
VLKPGISAEQLGDPLLHLLRRLVGEGEREDAEGVHALGHQVRDPHGEHFGLAAARPGDHHGGAIGGSTAASWAGLRPLRWSMNADGQEAGDVWAASAITQAPNAVHYLNAILSYFAASKDAHAAKRHGRIRAAAVEITRLRG